MKHAETPNDEVLAVRNVDLVGADRPSPRGAWRGLTKQGSLLSQPQNAAKCYPTCYPAPKVLHILSLNTLFYLARPERFELPTTWFEVRSLSIN